MASSPTRTPLTPANGYRVWSENYDNDANPMLSLDQRTLAPLLPAMDGWNVLDLGCGSGRWLNLLKDAGAANLVGVDLSPEMLSHAKRKLGDSATLICADYADAPILETSVDVVFCNFVLSYVNRPKRFLQFVRKVLKPGGLFFLSDVHPETATALNWKRGGGAQDGFQEIRVHHRPIAQIIAFCEDAGFEVRVRMEPPFGAPERVIFEQNGKKEYFEQIATYPAIYLLQLIAVGKPSASIASKSRTTAITRLYGARLAVGPTAAVEGEICIHQGCVQEISVAAGSRPMSSVETSIDLQGYLVLPGLINAHDHLEFALFPRLGKGGYRNFLEWAEDIHRSHAPEIARHRDVPKHVRLWWGGVRNVLCGVTTVCHHNPFELEVFSRGFIVRVLEEYGWAHSLALEPTAAQKKKQTPAGQKFFIHLAEGIDAHSREEIFRFSLEGVLDADTVVIHGLGLGAKGCALLRAVGAGLIWCPSSNLFLFGKSMSSAEIRRFPKVALGSDSPLSADGDLLDEVCCAHSLLQTPAVEVCEYVTERSAELLGLKNGEGSLGVGGRADLIAIRDRGLNPAEALATLSYRDIDLVLLGGRVQLASEQMKDRLPFSTCEGLEPLEIEGMVRWIRAPLQWMFKETAGHLGNEIYLSGRRVRLGN
jgi:cytosine/adenosine deaminase-related metal-dependent hydrolase/ubiquinone/menaquinone biosynthesis C-methylase UbiE